LSLWWEVTATWPLAIPADPPITSPHAKINRCVRRFKLFMAFTRDPLPKSRGRISKEEILAASEACRCDPDHARQ
jgi:hypothetical protein